MKRLLPILAVLSLLAAPAVAQDLDKGVEAYARVACQAQQTLNGRAGLKELLSIHTKINQ